MQYTGSLFSAGPSIAPRSCIFVRNMVHVFPLSELCSRDVTMVRMTYTLQEGARENLLLPQHISPTIQTNHPLSKRLREIIDYSSRKKLPLITGHNASAHHIILGSTDMGRMSNGIFG